MLLSARLAHNFTKGVRDRGAEVLAFGSLELERSGALVQASATGSTGDAYLIRLWPETGGLAVSCSCPYYGAQGPCKHIWAAILAAEEARLLRIPALGIRLPLHEHGPDDEAVVAGPPSQRPPLWRQKLTPLLAEIGLPPRAPWPRGRRVLYVIDTGHSTGDGRLVLQPMCQDPRRDGGWLKPKELRIARRDLASIPEDADRELLALLAGPEHEWGYYGGDHLPPLHLPPALASALLPRLCETGRCYWREGRNAELAALAWDAHPWQARLELRDEQGWTPAPVLVRGAERLDVSSAALVHSAGFVVAGRTLAPLANPEHAPLLLRLAHAGPLRIPKSDGAQFVDAVLGSLNPPPLDLPPQLQFETVEAAPRPRLEIRDSYTASKLEAALSFLYAGVAVPASTRSRGIFEAGRRRWISRDLQAESAAGDMLAALGLKQRSVGWEFPASKLPAVIRELAAQGWELDAHGMAIRRPEGFHIEVTSGIDWFDLDATVTYGHASAKLPDLLQALERRDSMVQLSDGSYGVLPEEWLQRLGPLAGLGAAKAGRMRFRRTQAGLLDALLAAQPEVRFDEEFARFRERLRAFDGIRPAAQPPRFQGQLRTYQCDGLGWMYFLRDFGFGGCLADDMGVGKTAQTLALLESRRELRAAGETTGPALAVVPRSLVFNWKEEARRFTPGLRVLDYTGTDRNAADFAAHDLVLTTYGILRQDIAALSNVDFDYVVLDEAQAIKNASSLSAKATRLLKARHRLALSGTPIENHIGELWSIFEFLNPGMLGASAAFQRVRNPDEATRAALAKALRPFILRRTKQQVASELPPKLEETLFCEMEPGQRRLYDDLRDHYRNTLLGRIDVEGMAKSKMHVLEALLRLRQAACHPGLIDKSRVQEPSAKLETLMAQLDEVAEGGHKALVFSQFTSLLAIVRGKLEAAQLSYEYLDGQTRDRQARVERFQNDENCKLFLVSLKAGGLGLNLTAADYVFLLDPWWNPAAEAQAVDRTHRIGQSRNVFAYRLIARDTIEEKVIELQQSKRDLADAIVTADNSIIGSLQREDLELLLS